MNRSMLAALLAVAALGACRQTPEAAAPEAPPAVGATPSAAPVPAAAGSDAALAVVPTPAADSADPDSEAAVDKAIDKALGDHVAYRKVMQAFQKAVAEKDAAAVAAQVHYPIAVEIAGRKTMLDNPAAFVEQYDRFMTPEIARAIADTRYADVLVNYKGVMLGQGEAWINGICKDNACRDVEVKVVAIQARSDLSP